MHIQNETILLVDDEPDILTVLEAMLDDYGHRIITKSDPASALSFIRDGAAISLVITDYLMPGMNGADFITALRQILPSVPVVMLTGCSMAVMEHVPGVSYYVRKPIERKELHGIVKAALART
jgi:DNA-binding NtrC family response regulator